MSGAFRRRCSGRNLHEVKEHQACMQLVESRDGEEMRKCESVKIWKYENMEMPSRVVVGTGDQADVRKGVLGIKLRVQAEPERRCHKRHASWSERGSRTPPTRFTARTQREKIPRRKLMMRDSAAFLV